MMNASFGFMGLGNMGGPMAARLINSGHKLYVCDRDDAAATRLVSLGATRLSKPSEVADCAETIFLSLPTPEIVEQVALSTGGLVEGKKIRYVIDLSTIGPRAAMKVAAGLQSRDIVYVDSPVSGGVTGAAKGTLAVMVSCRRSVYDAFEATLQNFGKVFYLGTDAGQAQTMKLANNIMSAAAVAITSEAVVMGVKAGLDPKVMLDVINSGSGRNTASQEKFPRSVLPRTFDVGFAAKLAYKDVRLCVDEAEFIGVPMIVGSAVREMLAITMSLCGTEADFSEVVKVCESWASVEVHG